MEKKYDRKDRNKAFEEQIKEIRKDNPNYGYRRIHAMLRKLGYLSPVEYRKSNAA